MQKSKYQIRKRKSLWKDAAEHSANILHTAVMTVPFCCCWFLYYGDRILNPFTGWQNWFMIAFYSFLYCVFCSLYGGFQLQISRKGEMIYSQVLSAFMTDICVYVVIVLLAGQLLPPLSLLAAFAAQTACSVCWTLAAQNVYSYLVPPLKTILVGDERGRLKDLIHTYRLERQFDILDSVSADDFLDNPERFAGLADAVFIWDIPAQERDKILKFGAAGAIPVYLMPQIGDILLSGARQIHMLHLPIMLADGYHPRPEYLLVKRLFDIIIAALALLILSPVLLVTSLIIRKDGGPAIYRQKRLTQGGKVFDIIKLRSMRMNAEMDGVARLSTGEDDDRITPIGRKIRAVRLDEVLQVCNVIMNSMSIVGPRPERPEIAEKYEEKIPEFSLRLLAKAGITGYAQVYGKYNTSPYEKLLMDLQYITKPSILNDLKIIFATVKILFMKESTEGVVSEDWDDKPDESAASRIEEIEKI